MKESIRAKLAQEADEAEARAEAEERGDEMPLAGQRARRQAAEPAQVYSVRIPVERLEELRRIASGMGAAPSTLLRKWVLERLDSELSSGSISATSRATAESSDFVAKVAEAVHVGVVEALNRLVETMPELRNLPEKSERHGHLKYLDPKGPVRLGPTRRLASLSFPDLPAGLIGEPTARSQT
jgi:hypothetical protein